MCTGVYAETDEYTYNDEEYVYSSISESGGIGEDDTSIENLRVNTVSLFGSEEENVKDPWIDNIIACNTNFIAILNTDGTVSTIPFTSSADSVGNYYNVVQMGDISDAVDIVSSGTYVSVLKSDGTVRTTQPVSNGVVNATKGWEGMKYISASTNYVAGVTQSGTINVAEVVSGRYPTWIDGEDDGEGGKTGGLTSLTGVKKVVVNEKWAAAICENGSAYYIGRIGSGGTMKSYQFIADNVVDIKGTDYCLAYITSDNTVKVIDNGAGFGYNIAEGNGGSTEWSGVKSISVSGNGNRVYIVGLMNDGSVKISTNNTPFTASVLSTIQSEIDRWANIKNVYSMPNYIIGEKENGTYEYISTSSSITGYLSGINSIDTDRVIDAVVGYKYSKIKDYSHDVCILDISNGYEDEDVYEVKVAKELAIDDNGLDTSNYVDVSRDTDENTLVGDDYIIVTGETEYYYRVFKNGLPSKKLKKISVNRSDYIASIVVNGDESYVSQDGGPCEFSFHTEYNGVETDAYRLKYNDNYSGSGVDYEANTIIRVESSSSYSLYGELITDGLGSETTGVDDELRTDVISRRFYYFDTPANYSCFYPEPYYPMSENDLNDIASGKLVRKSNIVKAVAGSGSAMVLKTNGNVQGAWITNGGTNDVQKAMTGPSGKFKMNSITNNSSNSFAGIASLKQNDFDSVGCWRMVSDIAVGNDHVVGLKHNGKVTAVGNNDNGQCNTGDWSDIVAVTAGSYHTVGLKSDGTVVAVGMNSNNQCDVGTWNNIYSISARNKYTVGISNDGRIYFTGDTSHGQNDVGSWEGEIIDISAGTNTVMGLTKYGKVKFAGEYASELNDKAKDWSNIVSIEAGADVFIGIDVDGRLYYAYPSSLSSADDLLGAVYTYDASKSRWLDMYGKNETDSWSDESKRSGIFRYLNMVGGRFTAVAVGDYSIVLVDTRGRVWNAIFSQAPTYTSSAVKDAQYPMIACTSTLNGSTILNNYESGIYNYDNLRIKLDNTTSEKIDWYFSRTGDDPEKQGEKYNNMFTMTNENGNNILKVVSKDQLRLRDYGETVTYYYLYTSPEIKSSTRTIKRDNSVEVDVQLKPSITGYTVYYTTDGKNPSNKSNAYNGNITLTEDTTVKAVAYCGNQKSSVYTFDIKVPTDISEVEDVTYVEQSEISQDTIWTKDKSPYIVQNNLTINSGSTLTVEPGVEVRFEEGALLTVNGSIVAEGTPEDTITFKSGDNENWGGISVLTGINTTDKNNSIKYVNIENAVEGLNLSADIGTFKESSVSHTNFKDCASGILINSKGYTVDNCKIDGGNIGIEITANAGGTSINNTDVSVCNIGIQLVGDGCSLEGCNISLNREVGIQTNKVTHLSASDCTIRDNLVNVRTGIVMGPRLAEIVFENCNWGSTNSQFIKESIVDYEDNVAYAYVTVNGYEYDREDWDVINITTPKANGNVLLNSDTAGMTKFIEFKTDNATPGSTVFYIGVYDKSGRLLSLYSHSAEYSSENIRIGTTDDNGDVDSALKKDVGYIKVFAWDELNPEMQCITLR